MQQYNSFQQYLQDNYTDVIISGFKKFILKEMNQKPDNSHHYSIVFINNCEIIGVQFTNSELDQVEFDVFF